MKKMENSRPRTRVLRLNYVTVSQTAAVLDCLCTPTIYKLNKVFFSFPAKKCCWALSHTLRCWYLILKVKGLFSPLQKRTLTPLQKGAIVAELTGSSGDWTQSFVEKEAAILNISQTPIEESSIGFKYQHVKLCQILDNRWYTECLSNK